MANVMLVEGWGLAGTITDDVGPETPPTLAALEWSTARGTATSNQNAISVADGWLTVSGVSNSVSNGVTLYRQVSDSARKIVLGFATTTEWIGNSSVFAYMPSVGIELSASPVGIVSAAVVSVRREPGGTLALAYPNSTELTSGIESGFVEGADNWVELVVDLDASIIELWVNSVMRTSVSLPDSYPVGTYSGLAIGYRYTTNYYSFTGKLPIGALYVADERLGRCQVATRRPTADAAVEFSRPQGDSNASQVADPDGADGDATYVSSATSGAEDLYASSDDLGLTNERIHAVAVTVTGRKEDVGNRSMTPLVGQGAAVSGGEAVALQIDNYVGTQAVFSIDPNSGAAWSLAGVESSTFGVRLTD